MDINSFRKKLQKISALSDSINDDGTMSPLERDLLLSYIRDLYEAALGDSLATVKIAAPAKQPVREPEKEVAPPAPRAHVPEPAPAPVPVAEPPKVTVSEPVAIPEPIAVPEPPRPVVKTTVVATDKAAMDELFAEDVITDLSDRLAHTPVKDLMKSMGINERIFTQQELFGNNQQAFNETLQQLNNCSSFGEARQYLLEHVVPKFDWTHDSKVKKAATFIKLVRRKYA